MGAVGCSGDSGIFTGPLTFARSEASLALAIASCALACESLSIPTDSQG